MAKIKGMQVKRSAQILDIFRLFLAEFKRAWIQFKRYPAESIGGVFIITSVFYGLFLSAQYIAGPIQFGDKLDSVIVGYLLWSLSIFVITDIAGTLQSEAQTGTLEQLFLTSFGARTLFLVRAIADLAIQLILLGVILLIIMVLTGRYLSFPIVLVLPLATVLMGSYGLGFIMGGISLLFKRIQQILAIFQFALLFLLTAPTEEWTGIGHIVGYFLPMSPGAGLLRNLMARESGLDAMALAIALVNGGVYLAIGLVLFGWAERETKRRGKLGGY